jgi:hypothetical protein
VWIAENSKILTTKVLNGDAEKIGELGKREENPFEEARSSTRGFFDLRSVFRL